MNALDQLRALRRGKVHAGYRWAAVMADGECICETCVEKEYSQVFKNTWLRVRRGWDYGRRTDLAQWPSFWPDSQWECIGIMNSGEHDSEDSLDCAHCHKTIFEGESA